MRKKRPVYYVLVPLMYIGIVFGLIVLQFSKSESFSQSWGAWTVSGRAPSAGGGDELLDFQIRGKGLEFTFSSARPAVVVTDDGTQHKSRPINWTQTNEGVKVLFQNQLVLEFLKGQGANQSLVVQPVLPDNLKKATRVILPFVPDGSAEFQKDKLLPLLSIRQGGNLTVASLDGGDGITDDNTFVLNVQNGVSQAVRIENASLKATPAQLWLGEGVVKAQADIDATLQDYWSRAYAGWSTSRYKNGQWDMGDGTVRFSEKLVSAYLGEALAKGDYGSALDKASVNAKTWGFQAMPYFGNLMDTTQTKRRQVEVAASQPNLDWTSWSLWKDATLYGPDGFGDRVRKALLSDPLPSSWAGKLSYLANLLEASSANPKDADLNSRVLAVFPAILSGIERQGDLVFTPTPEGWIDLRSSFLLGNLWLQLEKDQNDTTYQPVAAQLVLTALAHEDKAGLFPEILAQGDSIRQEGLVRPEEIYSAVSDHSLRELRLNVPTNWSSPAFLRTPAQVVSQVVGPSLARFSLKFPVGYSEFLILQGVPPFDHILMHGIRWRTDPEFQNYSDGWYYDSATKTLYVKIKHRLETEDLVIVFQADSGS